MLLFDRIFATGLVLWLVSMYIFLIGQMGLLRGVLLLVPPAMALVAIAVLLCGTIPSSRYRKRYSAKEIALFVTILVVVLFFIVPLASTPPVSRDALIHHLAVPKLYLKAGGIYEIPFMPFSYLPMNLDYLYLIPLYLDKDIVAKYIHLGFALLTAVLIYDCVKERSSRVYGLLSALVFVSTPVVVKLSTSAYVDLGVTFYSTLSVVALLKWMDGGRKRYLVFSALAGGFAMGVKYNGVITVFILSVFVLWHSARRGRQLEGLRDSVLYAGLSSLVFLPYLIRNYLWVENPFYPLIGGMIKGVKGLHLGGVLSPVEKRYVLYGEDTLDVLLVPLRIFFEGRDASLQYFDGVLNPVFVAFIPMLFLIRGKERWFHYLVCFAILYFYMVFFTADLAIRYILPAFAVFVVLIVLAIREGMKRRYTGYVTVALLAVMFVFNLSYVYGLYSKYRPLGFITGRETRDTYLLRVLPDYEITLWANRNLPETARVIFFFTGDRGYYWQRDYYYGDRLGMDLIGLVRETRSAERLKERLLEKGFTHMFINNRLFEKFIHDNFDARGIAIFSEFFTNHTRMLYTARGFSLYEIVMAGPAR